MLTTVIRNCWHALVRDVLTLGYRVSDMFTTLSWSDMVSIVVGAGPGTSVRWFLDQGWTRESHLLANIAEGQQGIARLPQPYARPGIEDRIQDPERSGFHGDAMTWEEMDRRDAKRYSQAGKVTPLRRGKRVIGARPGDRAAMIASGELQGTNLAGVRR